MKTNPKFSKSFDPAPSSHERFFYKQITKSVFLVPGENAGNY